MLITEMLITIKKLRQQTQKEPDYVFGSSELTLKASWIYVCGDKYTETLVLDYCPRSWEASDTHAQGQRQNNTNTPVCSTLSLIYVVTNSSRGDGVAHIWPGLPTILCSQANPQSHSHSSTWCRECLSETPSRCLCQVVCVSYYKLINAHI